MKGAIFPILLLLLVYTTADFVNQDYNSYIINRIESIPTTFFVYDEDFYDHLKECLSKDTIVRKVTSEKNLEIMKKMKSNYELQGIEELVDSSLLPHLIKIEFSGKEINRNKYIQFTETYDSLISDKGAIFQPEESYLVLFSRLERMTLFQLIYRIATGLLLFLLVLIIGHNYIAKTGFHWRVYIKAGGCKRRYGAYIQAFLLSMLLPASLFVTLLFGLIKRFKLDYSFDIRGWLIMLVIMILASQVAWIAYREDDL